MLKRLFGRRGGDRPDLVPSLPGPPTTQDILDAVASVEAQAQDLPGYLRSRVRDICRTVRSMAPRLDDLGAGSAQAHSVVATATSYLPEALGSYLRLPREWADTRPVQGGKTSLYVLTEQLDLLDATMDRILDAVLKQDADALVAHGQFLRDKFGSGNLDLGGGA